MASQVDKGSSIYSGIAPGCSLGQSLSIPSTAMQRGPRRQRQPNIWRRNTWSNFRHSKTWPCRVKNMCRSGIREQTEE